MTTHSQRDMHNNNGGGDRMRVSSVDTVSASKRRARGGGTVIRQMLNRSESEQIDLYT